MSGKFNIFLSHKNQDQSLAHAVEEALCDKCPSINIFRMTKIGAGTEWAGEIVKAIRQTHLFLLLFTDSTVDWDWCMYEAGLFHGCFAENEKRRLVCLQSPYTLLGAPPSPLARYQTVSATKPEVQKFLVDLYCRTNEYDFSDGALIDMEKFVGNQSLDEISGKIVNAFPRPSAANLTNYTKHLKIEVDDIGSLQSNKRIPEKARVSGDLHIFNIAGSSHHHWKEIEDSCTDAQKTEWIPELIDEVSNVCNGRLPNPIKASFGLYRPVLAQGNPYIKPAVFDVAFYKENTRGLPAALSQPVPNALPIISLAI